MNSDQRVAGGAFPDYLLSLHGAVILDVSGAVATEIVNADGSTRAAVAGDGLAAVIVDAVTTGDTSALTASRGSLSVVRAVGSSQSASEETPRGNGVTSAGLRERAFPVDMTNWSVAVDNSVVVKVVSEWGGAARATRQLSRIGASGAAIIPPFIGRLDWHHPERGTSTIGLVSGLIDGATDGWSWAVDDVLAFAAGGLEPEWPVALGQLTAELHRALVPSADNSTPRPTGANLRARAEAVLEQALAVTHGDAGVRLRGRAQHLRDTFARIPDDVSGPVFDIHGDLHVGQILRAPESSSASGAFQYWVLDFDGDPQLSNAERDQPDFSVRDVAHLLCSVDLVAAVVLKHLGSVSSDVRDWARRANAQLLDSYRSALAAAMVGEIFDERLIDGFVAEQLVRELLYADRFLPRWQYAPDAALTFRYPSIDPEEKPWTPPAFTTT